MGVGLGTEGMEWNRDVEASRPRVRNVLVDPRQWTHPSDLDSLLPLITKEGRDPGPLLSPDLVRLRRDYPVVSRSPEVRSGEGRRVVPS